MARGERSKNQTQISISLPKPLLEEIDECAKEENRTRSNFIVTVLKNYVERQKRIEEVETRQDGPIARKEAPTRRKTA